MVNRRTAIKQFLFVSAGMAIAQACVEDKKKASVMLKNIQIDGDQESLMDELAETIIPKTETPGARDISAHLFALKMVDDCFRKAQQDEFVEGLKAFDKTVAAKFGKPFASITPAQRNQLLSEMEGGKDTDSKEVKFYQTMKRLTIQAYTTSQFYLTKIHIYKLIPGPYRGCVPVNNPETNS